MFAEPTINDFIFNIRGHLDKALTNTRNGVEEIKASAAQQGDFMMSGVTISAIFADVRKNLENGIDAALGELKRAISTTNLNPQELRQAARQCLEKFTIGCQAATGADHFQAFPTTGSYIDESLRNFDEALRFKLRQFDVGFFDPQEPEIPHVSNTINVESMIGSAIQQGSPHATQTVHFTLNIGATGDAVAAFEAAIQGANLSENVRAEMMADIDIIRAQLAKTSPNITIVQEAGKSVRNVLEGIAAGLLTPAISATASALWSTIGLG